MCKVRYNTLNHEIDGLQEQWVPLLSAKIQDCKATVETGSLRLDSYRPQKVRAMRFLKVQHTEMLFCLRWVYRVAI